MKTKLVWVFTASESRFNEVKRTKELSTIENIRRQWNKATIYSVDLLSMRKLVLALMQINTILIGKFPNNILNSRKVAKHHREVCHWGGLYYFLCNQRTLVYVILSKKNIVDLAYVNSYVLMYFCLKLITTYVLVPKTYCIS